MWVGFLVMIQNTFLSEGFSLQSIAIFPSDFTLSEIIHLAVYAVKLENEATL